MGGRGFHTSSRRQGEERRYEIKKNYICQAKKKKNQKQRWWEDLATSKQQTMSLGCGGASKSTQTGAGPTVPNLLRRQPQIEVILNHVLKGCSLRAQVSRIIPAQISIVLAIWAHSLSLSLPPSLTSPLPHCGAGKLPSY